MRKREKRDIEWEVDLISVHHSTAEDKEILCVAQHNACSLTLAWIAQVLTKQ